MFGINALCQPILVHNPVVPPCLAESNITLPPPSEHLPSVDGQLHHSCFVHPLSLIAQTLDKLKPKEESKDKAVEVEALRFGTIIFVGLRLFFFFIFCFRNAVLCIVLSKHLFLLLNTQICDVFVVPVVVVTQALPLNAY